MEGSSTTTSYRLWFDINGEHIYFNFYVFISCSIGICILVEAVSTVYQIHVKTAFGSNASDDADIGNDRCLLKLIFEISLQQINISMLLIGKK